MGKWEGIEYVMTKSPPASHVINRRTFAGWAGLALATLCFGWRGAQAQDAPEPGTWQTQIDAIVGDAEPVEDKVTLNLPEIAENGNLVPFTVAVDAPNDETDFIRAIHIIATGNESPPVASFYFTPLSGNARASSRMRLRESQDIIALAQTSTGAFYIGRRRVEVVVGCCGE